MKKMRVLSAAMLGCVSSLAMAQSTIGTSSVTMYGLIDVGVNHVTGTPAGAVTSITGGNMEGSRFGFKGNEDLGGGYRAIFTLESRFEGDTGSLSNRPLSGGRLPGKLQHCNIPRSAGSAAASCFQCRSPNRLVRRRESGQQYF